MRERVGDGLFEVLEQNAARLNAAQNAAERLVDQHNIGRFERDVGRATCSRWCDADVGLLESGGVADGAADERDDMIARLTSLDDRERLIGRRASEHNEGLRQQQIPVRLAHRRQHATLNEQAAAAIAICICSR